jgi:hypothetical protein
MNIDSLEAGLYDDSNGVVSSVRLQVDGNLSFDLECDDWEGTERRRHFTITCQGLVESDLCVGGANAISLHREHPLLLDRVGKQGGLYFSSQAQDAHQIYADIWDILSEHYQGWKCPSDVIGHSPSSFRSLVEGGYGLLLRGPLSILATVQDRIGNALTTQLIETHTGEAVAVALVVEDRFVVCSEVEATEHVV